MSIHGIGGDCLILGLRNGRYSIPSILLLKQDRQNRFVCNRQNSLSSCTFGNFHPSFGEIIANPD